MENPSKEDSPVASPRAEEGGGAVVTSPRTGGATAVVETATTEAVVAPGGSVVTGGDGEEREEAVGVDVGGVVGGLRGVSGGSGGEDGVVEGSGVGEGSGGGDGVVEGSGDGDVGGERVVVEEVRVEEVIEGDEEDVPVADTPVVEEMVVGILVEDLPVAGTPVAVEIVVGERSGEPKGKGVATGESETAQRLTPLDYAENAPQEVVMERARENPAVLDAVLSVVREAREAEMAQSRAAEERDAEDWARDFEEEEEAEARAEEEAAQRPRVSVVEEARLALAERPHFDEATYDPQVHLFVPSGIDGFVSRLETYTGEEVLLDPEVHRSRDCLTVR